MFKTELITPGPAVETDPPEPIKKWLEKRGYQSSLVISRKDGKEISDKELLEIVALVEASEEK